MESTLGSILRNRRAECGVSLAELAEGLGVTKSYLSLMEAGKRQPTEEQVRNLARLLSLPLESLLLSAGRLPPDLQSAFAEKPAVIAASIRQEIEPAAVDLPAAPSLHMREILQVSRKSSRAVRKFVFDGDIRVGKNTTSYRVHSYHTKVPPEAILPFVEQGTRADGVVLDPFCGSGMTGLAALRAGRHALLIDISPAAVHIANNYVTPCSPPALLEALRRLEAEVGSTMEWLYGLGDRGEGKSRVEYTTWSDLFECPHCHAVWSYWDLVQHGRKSSTGQAVFCLACGRIVRKQDLQWRGEIPVESSTSTLNARKIDHHTPTEHELRLVAQADTATIPFWIPQVNFSSDREMWRASHAAMGVSSVADFYSRRNLYALAALRHAILQEPDLRIRGALLFIFTATLNRASRRYQWNPKRPTNVMTGTLYISSVRYEWNVWSLFRRKAADAIRYYQDFTAPTTRAEAIQASATNLDFIPDAAIDLVFMDPPFGSNIFYSDSALLWEAWLGAVTDERQEIVVNQRRLPATGGKSLEHYQRMLTASFSEVRRVLKSGASGVLAFSNTDDAVWQAVQEALSSARLEIASTHVLDKTQRSIKGVKGEQGLETVARHDVLMCLKRGRRPQRPLQALGPDALQAAVDSAIDGWPQAPEGRAHRPDEIHTSVVRNLLERNVAIAGATVPAVLAAMARAGGRGRSPRGVRQGDSASEEIAEPSQCAPPSSPLSEYLSDPRESLTCSGASRSVPPAIAPQFPEVAGSRNTVFYNAHSYHTKVPPETIVPFIEYFTAPKGVVLDPFAGSGMTGVAAALAGRRAILNDLSPAAAHLSYNHTHRCEPQALAEEFERLYREYRPRFSDLYQATHLDGRRGYLHYVIWSKYYRCPECKCRFSLWNAIDRASGRLGTTVPCPECGQSLRRQTLRPEANLPAWVSYEVPAGESTERIEREATDEDVTRALHFDRAGIREWYPRVGLGPDREMYIRSALHLQQIREVADFYTARNLAALATLWEAILAVRPVRVRQALAFAFTNTAWHGTRMRRFNARGGQRPLTGTLYVPQLSSEVNVLEVMRNKISQLVAYYSAFRPQEEVPAPTVMLGSATQLENIPDASIDYVFTDPPFGSNIFYSDCNLIWESWLGVLTDTKREAVVNRSLRPSSGGKTLRDYRDLMAGALRETKRVLKAGAWATLVFHNTDPLVWRALQEAADAAGFLFDQATALDRKQLSHKGYKGRSGSENVAHFDVIMNLRKRTRSRRGANRRVLRALDLDALLHEIHNVEEARGRGFQWIHSLVMREIVTRGFDLGSVGFEDLKKRWEELFGLEPHGSGGPWQQAGLF